jgi:hypothetical protein
MAASGEITFRTLSPIQMRKRRGGGSCHGPEWRYYYCASGIIAYLSAAEANIAHGAVMVP